ncbi:olfactory receptor 6X1-like [Terrapene carolina triunguis]|uniref:olfactory receptor 6X1-like n=1 Tax=Terrapene triunguis TaxID=2587831 RepID=UPI000CEF69FB|nr:olfactory receptor 6X1-like [Terrapene carolina triunguis]
MHVGNQTLVTEFILRGFPMSLDLQTSLFMVVLLMYILTIVGNVLIIVIVIRDPRLHTPMYFFLGNLSFLEIWYITTLVPKMLANFLAQKRSISLRCCLTQAFFHFFLGATEFFLLAAMSFDRYLAVCDPLHYGAIMSNGLCLRLALGSWLGGFLTVFLQTILVCQLPFCGPNLINHFYCDVAPLLKLACADTRFIEQVVFAMAALVLLSSFSFTTISYVFIIWAVLRIPSNSGRQRAFSTCASHLTVVSILYGTVIFMYVRPKVDSSLELNKVVSVLNTVITPLLNPFIYTLRNKEVKEALKKAVCTKKCLTKNEKARCSAGIN